MGLFTRKKFKPLPEYGNLWVVSSGLYEGNPIFVRLRTSMSDAVGHPGYPLQIGVAVPLAHPTADGLPSRSEADQLAAIEDGLIASLSGYAELVAVLTTSGMREFVLYTAEAAREHIVERVTALNADVDSHALQLMIQDDPAWDTYTRFAA